jgi:dCMP deaminase
MLSTTTLNTSVNPFLSKWDRRFLRIAEEVRTWSKDPGTKVGCVLVSDRRLIASGYNGFPSTLSDSLTLYEDRDYKLAVTVHAEANAIMNAAKNGAKTQSCTAYVTFPPCSQCAASLIQAGVERVVCPDPETAPERWRASFKLGNEMLYNSGVKLLYYSQDDLQCLTETAQSVVRTGSRDNSTGQRGNQAKTLTSTLSSAADFLPRRLSDA